MASRQTSKGHRSWRAAATSQAAATTRRFKRMVMTTVLVSLVVTFGVLMFILLWQPRVHMVCLPIQEYDAFSAPPMSFSAEDVAAFSPLRPGLYESGTHQVPVQLPNLQTSDGIQTLSDELTGIVTRSRDVLIVYLSGHGIAQDGKAYVLCSDFRVAGQSAGAGRYELAALLEQLRDTPAKLKVVLFDAGPLMVDSRMGMLVNEFPRLLRQQVEALGDRSLWVLCSHREMQRSHVSQSLRRSVFGYFVSTGLAGAADENEDGEVDLRELSDFVVASVADWVNTYTAEVETQTPTLLWAGGSGRHPDPAKLVLIPVTDENAGQPPTAEDEATEQEKNATAQRSTGRPRLAGLLGSGMGLALLQNQPPSGKQPAAKSSDDTSGKAAPDSGTPATAKSQGDAASESQPASKDTPAADPAAKADPQPPAKGKNAPDFGSPAAKGSLAADNSKPTEEETKPSPQDQTLSILQDAWMLRDRLQRRTAQHPHTPVDYAPHLWREFNEQLLRYEWQARAGDAYVGRNIAKRVEDQILVLQALLREPPVDVSRDRAVGDRLAAARVRMLDGVDRPQSIYLAALYPWPPGSPMRSRIPELERWLDDRIGAISPPPPAIWQPEGLDAQEFVELNMARALAEKYDGQMSQGTWDAIRRAMQVRVAGERVASYCLWRPEKLNAQIRGADEYRIQGERALFESPRDDRPRGLEPLASALAAYNRVEQELSEFEDLVQLRNDLLFRVPYYVRWHEQANGAAVLGVPAEIDLVNLFVKLRTVMEHLEDDTLVPGELGQLYELQQQVELGLSSDQVDSLCRDPNQTGNAWRIELLLSTPLLTADQRRRLWDAAAKVNHRSITVGRFSPLPTSGEPSGDDWSGNSLS